MDLRPSTNQPSNNPTDVPLSPGKITLGKMVGPKNPRPIGAYGRMLLQRQKNLANRLKQIRRG